MARTKACRGVLQAFSIPQVEPTPLYSDSDSTAKVARDEASPRRSLYLMLRARFITDSFKDKETIVMHVGGELNPADAGTKYLSYDTWHRYLRYVLNF